MSLKENENRIADLLAGELSAAEKTALENHLRECSECREAYEDARAGETSLTGFGELRGPDLQPTIMEAIRRLPVDSAPPSNWLRPAIAIIGLLGILAVVAFIGLQGSPVPIDPPRPNLVPETATPASGAPEIPKLPDPPKPLMLAKAEGNWSSTSVRKSGEAFSQSGFTTSGNGKVEVTGPGNFRIVVFGESEASVSSQKLILSRGTAWCQVNSRSSSHPFGVESAAGMVQVVGTCFGVQTTSSKMVVDLFEGKVRVTPGNGEWLEVTPFNRASIASPGVNIEALASSSLDIWGTFLPPSVQEAARKILLTAPIVPVEVLPASATATAPAPVAPSVPASITIALPASVPEVITSETSRPGQGENPLEILNNHQPSKP